MFPFSIFKVAEVVLSMEADDLPMAGNTSWKIMTVSRLNSNNKENHVSQTLYQKRNNDCWRFHD